MTIHALKKTQNRENLQQVLKNLEGTFFSVMGIKNSKTQKQHLPALGIDTTSSLYPSGGIPVPTSLTATLKAT